MSLTKQDRVKILSEGRWQDLYAHDLQCLRASVDNAETCLSLANAMIEGKWGSERQIQNNLSSRDASEATFWNQVNLMIETPSF